MHFVSSNCLMKVWSITISPESSRKRCLLRDINFGPLSVKSLSSGRGARSAKSAQGQQGRPASLGRRGTMDRFEFGW